MDVPVAAVINLIRENLNDRYRRGFPVIKELIQNADDAGATRFDFGISPGLPHASHSLLRGPALVVANNGRFTDVDASAINSIGLSSKPAEHAAIGKFGLGLKSIFHFCEAFFYFHSEQEVLRLVNPWAVPGRDGIQQDNLHPEWNVVKSEDAALVRAHLSGIFGHGAIFCLWIPLRRHDHSKRIAAITDYYPGDLPTMVHDLLAPEDGAANLYEQCAALMPLLSHLQLIQRWDFDSSDSGKVSFRIQLQTVHQRRRPITELSPGQQEGVFGVLRLETENAKPDAGLHFQGREWLPRTHAKFDELRQSPYWPKQLLTDSTTFAARVEADKAIPHAAVYLARCPSTGMKSNLYVSNAVFLPVGQSQTSALPSFKHDIHLVLHGYFFVDAGRSHIEGLDDALTDATINDVRTLRKQWNARLFQHGTLPLLLPALADFVERADLPFDQVQELTSALQALELHRHPGMRSALCSTHQWMCCVAPGHRRWQLLRTEDQVLPLPKPPDADLDRPFAVLPNLKQFPYLTIDDLPRLSASDTLSAWDSTRLATALEINVRDVFDSATSLRYLADFLDICSQAAIGDERVQQRLLAMGRDAMRTLGPSALGKNRSLFARFYAKLAPQHRLEILIPRSLAGESATRQQSVAEATDAIFKALANVSGAPLIVPIPRVDDAIDLTGGCTIVSDVLHRLLATLEGCAPRQGDEIFDDVITEVALRLLKRTNHDWEGCPTCAGLRLFNSTIVGKQSDMKRRLSLQEMRHSKRHGKLFKFANPPKPLGLGRELGRALADSNIALVKAETLKDLGPDEIGTCDLDGCLQLLKLRPSLSQIEERLDLLRELLRQERWHEIDFVAAVRYLFHSRPNRYDDASPLLVTPDGDGTWDLLMRRALAVRIDERWRIVPAEVVPELTPRARVPLHIQTLGPANVAAMLEDFSDEELAAIDMSELDRSTLLLGVDSPRVIANLRIHRSALGDYVVIQPGHTYLADDFDLPQTLSEGVVLLQRELDHKLRQRYTEFLQVPPLNAAAVLTIALCKPNLHRFSGEIMDALAECGSDLRGALLTQVRETKWLPLPYCKPGFAAPCDIVHIPDMEEEIDRLLAANDVGYYDVLQIDPMIRHHSAWKLVCSNILPSADDAVDKLAIILELAPEYHVGDISDQVDSNRVDEFIELWQSGQAHTLQPAAVLLSQIAQRTGSDTATRLWKSLCHPIPAQRSVSTLNYLRAQHCESAAKHRGHYLKWFNIFLAAAASQPDFADGVLPHIYLLNQRGDWRQTDCLCHGYMGIDRSDLLDVEQAKCMGMTQANSLDAGAANSSAAVIDNAMHQLIGDDDFTASAERLRKYFDPWTDYIAGEPIGGLLCLLGDFPDVLRLAEKFLAPRHVTETRNALDWTPLTGWAAGSLVGGAGLSIHQALSDQRFTIDIVESTATTQSVLALTGSQFQAKMESLVDIQHLVVDDRRDTSPRMVGNLQVNRLRLRQIELKHFEPRRLIDLLAKTALHVLSHNYAQKPANFIEFWEDLLASEQLDIEIAQQWILESIPHYLPTLGLRGDPDIGPLIKAWDELDLRKIETEHGMRIGGSQRSLHADVLAERERIHGHLSAILMADGPDQRDVQTRVLTAMRGKIQDEFQYRVESVLFELFQNADDAVAELQTATDSRSAMSDLYQSAVVELQDDALVFAHWGRAINQLLVETDGSVSVGHRHDLVKMLALHTSDKQASGETIPLTGKFGLGFKTVYLLSDRPHVLSGRLAFDISGGIYPRRLIEDKRKMLEELRTNYTDGRQQRLTGTIIYLTANGSEQQRPAAQQALTAFKELAGVTVVFAHQIKRIEFRKNGQTVNVRWRPKPVDGCPSLALGGLHGNGAGNTPDMNGLLLSSVDAALLLALGARGFEPLPKQVPTIWVTVPTLEKLALGFAINARFDLDIGRAQLARNSETNQQLTTLAGQMLATALRELATLAQDWQRLCSELNLAANTTAYEFWDSLWSVLVEPVAATPEGEAGRLLRTMVGGPGLGMQSLMAFEAIIPTRLPGQFRGLAKVDQVRFTASGILEEEDILETVATWPGFSRYVKPGLIVHGKVADALRSLLTRPPTSRLLTPLQLVKWEVGDNLQVEPETADRLGTLFTQEFLANKLDKFPAQLEELRAFLRTLEFRNANDRYVPARDMLIGHDEAYAVSADRDELLRAAFAPSRDILNPTYNLRATSFFRVCRERLVAPVETLVTWAFEAEDEARKHAVLNYCIHGQLRSELVKAIRRDDRFSYSWFQQLDRVHPLFSDFNPFARDLLLSDLELLEIDGTVTDAKPLPRLDVGRTLANIYAWWAKERAKALPKYEEQTYPNGAVPPLAVLNDTTHPEWRRAWLTLFVLGASHTIGRVQPEANRNFLVRCQQKGWFDIFADPNAPAEQWIQVLDEYLEDDELGALDQQYWHFVGKQFVSIYQLSHYLGEYVEAFRYLDRSRTSLTLEHILSLRTSQLFQGSGLDAPSIRRTLGLGACFVVRELVRLGAVSSPQAYSHCYVPVKRVRDRLIELGCPLDDKPAIEQSAQIHRFLCKHLGEARATFDHSFDIPFQELHRQFGRIPSHLCVYQ